MTENDDEIPIIIIRRDWRLHRWVYGNSHAAGMQTPWSSDASADDVVRWLKTEANGKLRVQVDLG